MLLLLQLLMLLLLLLPGEGMQSVALLAGGLGGLLLLQLGDSKMKRDF